MTTFYTHYKSICLGFVLLASIVSCSNQGNINGNSSFIDTNAFPKKRFSSVVLFALNSMNRRADDSLRKSKAFIYVGSWGNSFIDSLGKPQTSLYKDYILDAKEVGQLEQFLIQEPCKDSMFLDKACAPTYKNVFVFYDAEKHSIAQLHICFLCQKAEFKPDENYMCDFENKVDFKKFEAFVNSIKKRK